MGKQSKRTKFYNEKLAGLGSVSLEEAVEALKSLDSDLPAAIKPVKMDQTIELAVRLGVDPRQADQLVRGSIILPHGIGKTQRVVVFAQGANLEAAEAAGADAAGGKDLADKIKGGWLDFDVAIATPDMMGVVGPLGRVLGPRGLMPSPRAGTVTQDVESAVKDYKAGKVEFRVDAGGNVHCRVGKMSFDAAQLIENIQAMLKFLDGLRPSSVKGTYVRNIAISATMSPGISVAL
ncbi:50S ribosomal protein L1 [Gimesia panareensis]|uniref:Large ribosomal subunit protein uL1 n=1 Tax=Gimesia panareensis TaxID=2527978 RepID=A0A517QF90_9PLAN|nr:50S ribosomal protein L1 [Gimesia panareensis]QDT30255.1 50S ribosomal protein L1 [Gimesia panareensis]QDU53329.1 50S ribosomal protein L1 [Gimesia panareensis]